MLYLQRQKLDTANDLRAALGNAITLELSTIPPYLIALFSIKPGCNAAIAAIIRSVVVEEMLHLALTCNLLNGVGGRPDLGASVLRYPASLPMNIGSEPGKPFVVGLTKLSLEVVRDIFMVIEEPEHGPLTFGGARAQFEMPIDCHTIGAFYAAVADLIDELGPTVFTGHPSRQVTGYVGTEPLRAVNDMRSARAAINTIVTQGEGTLTSPDDERDDIAHFYRFEEIQRGQTLNRDPRRPGRHAWGLPTVIFDADGVWPMIDNPPDVPLPAGSAVAALSDQCDGIFRELINGLQRTFDGEPGRLSSALAQMYALRLAAQRLVQSPVPNTQGTAGPRFSYRSE